MSQTAETMEIPEKWKSLPIADMIAKGWRARHKKGKGAGYMTLRNPKQTKEKSLGPYTPEKWGLLMQMFPDLENSLPPDPLSIPSKSGFSVRLNKPKSLSGGLNVSLDTLRWYEHFQSKGYDKSLGDFLSEITQMYFGEKKMSLRVVIVR